MPKLTKYDPATDGNPVDWLHVQSVTNNWEVWTREHAGGTGFLVGLSRGVVEHTGSAATLPLAVEAVTAEIIDDIADLIS